MACPDFCRISCSREIPLDFVVAAVDVCKISQARPRDGNPGSRNAELEKGADVNAQGGRYGNALQAASSAGQEEVDEMLVEKGAELREDEDQV